LKLWRCEDYGNDAPTFTKQGSITYFGPGNGVAIQDLNNPEYFVEDCCPATTIVEPLSQGFWTPNCCPETLIVRNLTLFGTQTFKAKQHILVENCTVADDAELTFKGVSIDGVADLEIPAGASVDMLIENPCPNGGKRINPNSTTPQPNAHTPVASAQPTHVVAPPQATHSKLAMPTATLYPNPFKRSTGIELRLADACLVQVAVFDATMRPIATISDGRSLSAGTHELEWDASNVAAGIYIVQVAAGSLHQTFKVVKVE